MDIGTTRKIAVYGTLRNGFGNHRYLKNSKFIGTGKTVESFTLSANGIPFVHKDPLHNVVVEVYEVNDNDLKNIDSLEGHPNWYKREITNIQVGNQIIPAWLYFYPKKANEIIESGDYKDYRL